MRSRPSVLLLLAMAAVLCLLPGSGAWAGAVGAGDRLASEHRLLSAIGRYQEAARMPGGALPAALRSGRGYLRRGQPLEAVRTLQQVAGTASSDRGFLLLLAEAQQLSGDAGASLATLRGLLERRPDDLEAWCLLVERSARAGLSPRDAGIPMVSEPRSSGDARLDQRAAYLWGVCTVARPTDGGAASLRRATLGPDPVVAADARGLLAAMTDGGVDPAATTIAVARELLARGYPGPALERLRSVPAVGRSGAEAWALVGYAEIGLGRMDGAAESLRRSVEAWPDQPLGQFVQGLLLRKTGDAEGAARRFRAVMSTGTVNPGVDLEMAAVLTDLGDYGGAEMILRRAVEAEPADPEIRLAAARFYVDRQYRMEEGLVQSAEAVRLAPASAQALETHGWALHLAGQSGEAVDTLRHAVALDPESARLRYRLGSVYEGLGERDRAREQYHMVRELDGAGDQWKRAEAALEDLDSASRP